MLVDESRMYWKERETNGESIQIGNVLAEGFQSKFDDRTKGFVLPFYYSQPGLAVGRSCL